MPAPARPFLGILTLDSNFPRFAGDIGHPATWDMPVRYAIVAGASPKRIVGISDESFLAPFLDAGRALIADGAAALSTSCGFLVAYQAQLAQALPVPVLASSLLLHPLIARMVGGDVGILTFSPASLGQAHLTAAGIHGPVAIGGLTEGCAFQRAVMNGADKADTLLSREAEIVEAAQRLLAQHPGLKAILCECTNFGPHRAAIARSTGLPVFDMVTALRWFWQSVNPEPPAYADSPPVTRPA